MSIFTNPLLITLTTALRKRIDQYPVCVLGMTVHRKGDHVFCHLPDGDTWIGNYGMSYAELEQALTEYMEDVE